MIDLTRPRVIPPTLRPGGKGATAAVKNEESYRDDPRKEPTFDPHWREPDVRGALFAMQGWVCAYCQRALDPRDPKYVDHFRPKRGGYWWLAYLLDNLFLTCAACNTR